MIDLHCHILPGVDDGPRDLAEAVTMCALAAEDGCTTLVATPHQRHPSWPDLDRRLFRTRFEALLEAIGDRLEIRLGAEIRVDADLLGELEKDDPSFVSLAGSRYLLLELDRWGTGPEPEDLVHEAAVTGWIPVLAHPELIPALAEDRRRVEGLVEDGALLQVTAAAVTGGLGRAVSRTVSDWIDGGLVHFVASDAHAVEWRPPGLGRARRALSERWGESVAHDLTVGFPERVLGDLPWAEPSRAVSRGEVSSP